MRAAVMYGAGDVRIAKPFPSPMQRTAVTPLRRTPRS